MDKQAFLNAREYHHKTLTNSDGTPRRFKRNGANKLWKTRPEEFRIPVKRGMYEFGYIDHDNCLEFEPIR